MLKSVSLIVLTMFVAYLVSGCGFTPLNEVESFPIDPATPEEAYKAYSTTGFKLVWSDEFDGSALDLKKWNYDIGNGVNGWGNWELQYYTDRTNNVLVSDGTLKIISLKENYEGYSYTSGRIHTLGKFSFQFGKIVARIRLSSGNRKGIWPAFWMMGTNFPSVGWPYCGEIDIMENIGEPKIYSTCHWWDEVNGWHAEYGLSTSCDITNWHDYEVEWDSKYIRARLDGVQFYEILIDPSAAPTLTEFQYPFYILLNQAVGGNWPGRPTGTTVFPAIMEVDYVRVYKSETTTSSSSSSSSSLTSSSSSFSSSSSSKPARPK